MAPSPASSVVLDLVDIALLLHYETFTTEPRLRGAKLREVAYPGEKLTTVALRRNFAPGDDRSQTSMVFDIAPRQTPASSATEPDLPTNMVPPENLAAYPKLNLLTAKQLETLFYQARGHDGCFTAVGLLQKFLGLFPPGTTQVRIRHGPAEGAPKGSRGWEYTTGLDAFRIVEQTLLAPRFCTTIAVQPAGTAYVSGHEPTLTHAVAAFAPLGATGLVSFLDLSSLQFGDVGRGLGGAGVFALDTLDEFNTRMGKLGKGVVDAETKISHGIGRHPNDGWLTAVAQRAKERWEKRGSEKWCGHCGAPVSTAKTCAGCGAAWYCSREHQKMAWGLHKHYCGKK